MCLLTKYWQIILIYFEHDAQKQEKTYVYYWAGHFINYLNVSLLELKTDLRLVTFGLRSKGHAVSGNFPHSRFPYSFPLSTLPKHNS